MSKIGLIIQREYNERVKKRSFILTTILTPLLFVALMVVPMLVAMFGSTTQRTVVVVDQSGVIAPKLQSNDVIVFDIAKGEYPDVQDQYKDAFGFLVIDSNIVANPTKLMLYTRESTTMDVEKELRSQVQSAVEGIRIEQSGIEGIDSMLNYFKVRIPIQTFSIGESADVEKESSSAVSMGIAYASGFIIYFFIFLYGAMVMQGVIEEKSSRIIEVIVSSVKPFELMMGKIVGIAFVALTQVLIWILIGTIGLGVMQSVLSPDVAAEVAMGGSQEAVAAVANSMPSEMNGALSALSDLGYIVGVLISFLLFFVGGYLLYAAMFAAIGSGVDNAADTQQLQLPVTIPLILSIIMMMSVMQEPNSALAFWFSVIPFTSPIIMMARVAYGVPFWELALSLVVLYGSFVLMTMFAARIYRVGIFMYGKKPSLKELVKWSKYKS